MRPRTLFAILAVTLTAAACSSGGTPASSPQPPTTAPSSPSQSPSGQPSPPGGTTVTLTQADFQFSPANLVISKSQGLTISNTGPSLHNFTVQGTQVDIDVQPGSTDNLEAIGQAVPVGQHPFFCKYHQARGMVGVITVVP
jgi:plastocyanin